MKKLRITACAFVFVILASLTGCSTQAGDMNYFSSDKTFEAASLSVEDGIVGGYMEQPMEMHSTEMKKQQKNVSNDLAVRKIIKNASLSFETTSYDEFIVQLENCILSLGGYIETSEAYGTGIYTSRSRNTYLRARIPAAQYQNFMTEACALGTLTYKTESSDDVTLSYVDTESRIRALRTEYEALLEILEKAENLDDVIQLQSRITEVTYQLDSYESQLRKYDDLVAYCTFSIDITEVRRITQDEEVMTFGERIGSGLSETFYDIRIDLTDFTVWFVTSLPYIVIWGALITAVTLIIKWKVTQHKKKKEQKIIEQFMKENHENESEKNP